MEVHSLLVKKSVTIMFLTGAMLINGGNKL